MVERVSQKLHRVQASACSLPSLYKYMRKRKIMSKTGYYFEIKSTGEVCCTRNPSSIYSVLLVLSVGPNFVAIVGQETNKYLAVDDRGRVFTSSHERKECVFREFLGRNFHTLLRTCHSDASGCGWYLSINDQGRVRAEKVAYSNEPQLHFIIKVVIPDDKIKGEEENPKDAEQVWKHQESASRSTISSWDRSTRNSSPASTSSSRSEYSSPLGFYERPINARPASFSGHSAFVSPASRSEHSAFMSTSQSPVSFSGRSEYGTPLSFMGNSGYTSPTPSRRRSDFASPVSFSGRSEYGTPLSFMGNYASPVGSPSDRPDLPSLVAFSDRSPFDSPVSFSGRSEYGTPLSFMVDSTYASPDVSPPGRSDFASPVSFSGRSEYGTPLSFMGNGGHASPVNSEYGHASPVNSEYGHASPVHIPRRSEYGHASPINTTSRSDYGTPLRFIAVTHGHGSPTSNSGSASSESPLSDRSGSSLSGKNSFTPFGKTTTL